MTKSEIEKKETRNKTILGIILAVVMLLGTLGLAFESGFFSNTAQNSANQVDYNGTIFYKTNSEWTTVINNQNFVFQYLPSETEDIKAPSVTIQKYYNQPLFLVSDNSEATGEIARSMGLYTLRTQEACFEGQDCSRDLPVKNCTDNVIIIKQADTTKIYSEDNCIFIEGNDTIRAADAFIYKVLGI